MMNYFILFRDLTVLSIVIAVIGVILTPWLGTIGFDIVVVGVFIMLFNILFVSYMNRI